MNGGALILKRAVDELKRHAEKLLHDEDPAPLCAPEDPTNAPPPAKKRRSSLSALQEKDADEEE